MGASGYRLLQIEVSLGSGHALYTCPTPEGGAWLQPQHPRNANPFLDVRSTETKEKRPVPPHRYE